MLRTRLLTAIILIPIVIGLIYLGGVAFLALVTLLLTLAEVEFCDLVAKDGFRPNVVLGIGGMWFLLMDAYLPVDLLRPGLALLLLGSLAWQIFHRQGAPVANWALTVTSGLYLGICGACLINLREQTDGLWWTMTSIPSIMLADTGAYFVGRVWGRHKMAPTLSPGKTWEGYVAGIISGGLLTGLLASLWCIGAGPDTILTRWHGFFLGSIIAILAPLGDLGVSMIKRTVEVKDSGNIIPGHGGALDRVDSVLWAAVIGYYYVQIVSSNIFN